MDENERNDIIKNITDSIISQMQSHYEEENKRLTAIENMIDSIRAKTDITESEGRINEAGNETIKRIVFRDGKYIEE